MKTKSLICFDMDGTLIDSKEEHIQSFKQTAKKNNLKIPTNRELVKQFGPGIEKVIKKIYPRISSSKYKQFIEDYVDAHEKNSGLVKAFPHVKDALLKLKKHFKLGIVSNTHHEAILDLLESAKIPTKLFDVIIGEDDAKAKPAPDEILLAEKLTKSNAKYMVGDTIFDIKAGKKANCKTIGVLTGIHNMEQLMKTEPDILAASVAILPDILLNN